MRSPTLGLFVAAVISSALTVVACSSTGAAGAADGSDGGTSGGTSGSSGTSGTSGTSGASGASGTSGTSGTSGGVDGGPATDGGDGGPVGTPAVQLIGRFDTSDPAGPRFAWPGTRIIASFDGTAVSVKLTQTPGFEAALPTYFDVVFDGVVGTPFTVSGTQTVVLASGKPAGPHTVEIMKRTEANFGTVRFEGFTFSGGAGLLAPPAPLAHKIEFLGDSTIDGYGIEGTYGDLATCGAAGAPPQYDEARKSVSWLSAAGLGAELHLLGYSGKGLARNEGGSTTDTFPVIYTRTLPDVAGSTWTFSSWVPDAVVIALGGADYSGDPNGTFPATFRATYQTLLGDIRTRYGAGTYVFLTVWSQYKAYDGVRQELTAAIDQAIASRPAGEKNYKLVLPEADFAADETGCQLHGNATHHAAMAVKVIKGIKDVTLWP